jgi:STE24 endopeptidase
MNSEATIFLSPALPQGSLQSSVAIEPSAAGIWTSSIRKSLVRVLALLFAFLALNSNCQTLTNDTPAPGWKFDPEFATRGYLARLSGDKKARSDAYFEGGYWLLLWNFLYTAAIYLLLLQSGLSARMRTLACRITRFKPIQTALYGIQFILVIALIQFPFSVYTDFVREHKYELSNQTIWAWFGDWAKGLLVSIIIGSLLFMILFGVVRRLQRSWHFWGAVVAVGFLIITVALGPVYIAPLFNKYTPLADPKVTGPILRIARANGIYADKVYEMDASKQSPKISANVSGMLGTMRITLNDNLLSRASLPSIEAVMAHEIGHYVLNHVYKMLLAFGVLIVIGFFLLRSVTESLLVRYGSRWGITDMTDLAVTPLAALIFSTYLFLLTPATNTLVRTQEMEADIFGLNAAREPDGFAEAALLLSEYRKMEPGPIEEWIFFDHPSGATRIRTAMRWKAENLGAPPPLQGR